MQTEAPRAREPEPSEQAETAEPSEPGLRFDDAYWDDAFCAWGDPTMRSCCG